MPFKYYGNYGGPYYSSGIYDPTPEESFSEPAIDNQDVIYKHHDRNTINMGPEMADSILIADLRHYLNDPGNTYKFIQRAQARAAMIGFKAKALLEKYTPIRLHHSKAHASRGAVDVQNTQPNTKSVDAVMHPLRKIMLHQ
jgi:hypothetical protein